MNARRLDAEKRMQHLAVKQLCLRALAGFQRNSESLSDLYRDVSACLPTRDVAVLAAPGLKPGRSLIAPPHTGFRDLTPWRNGKLLGVEVCGQQLTIADMAKGFSPAPVSFGLSALTATRTGFAGLSAKNQQIVLLDDDLVPAFRRGADELNITLALGSRITAVRDLLAVALPDARKVLFLTPDLEIQADIHLPGAMVVHDLVGYRGGVLLSESTPPNNQGGGLLWLHPDGAVLAVTAMLDRPMGVSVLAQGVVVCDFAGIHFIALDGLAVAGHSCLPWAHAAPRLGASSGYFYEAIVRGGTMTTILRLASGGVNRNTNFCLYEHVEPEEAWPKTDQEGGCHAE
ncbi:hypothetical protein GKC30_07770 [Pseudodesulfovibrio sp. F-1]|uniref:Uncharacterized protein n=1 Tax=Pseudodesulfovibrio alkaliphilus TaxID=2661613 RepID=A0A7K1KN72_9BACT|nr:hypothetical protein [Pseudodesulfovibrio alkaliphilus]MUM77525.1 hypothetical protein [Pseudodesulfovibrio alkaliphilus]